MLSMKPLSYMFGFDSAFALDVEKTFCTSNYQKMFYSLGSGRLDIGSLQRALYKYPGSTFKDIH